MYSFVHRHLENKLCLRFKKYHQLLFTTLIWQLYFKGRQSVGKYHVDLKRCLFGDMVRVLICVNDTSDYTILVENKTLKLKYGDLLLIPNKTYHAPLGMTHGERTYIVLDFFTCSIIDPVKVILFCIFSHIKIFGINV